LLVLLWCSASVTRFQLFSCVLTFVSS
jgi:hypothetical protein